MNRTALALLQGRLWEAARDYDARLHGDRERAEASLYASGLGHAHGFVEAPAQPATLESELQRVLRALERIDQGRYGFCESCGQAIDPDQLFDRPQRFACAACDRGAAG